MKKIISLTILCCLLVAMLTACDSSDYKKALKLYNSGQYSEAMSMFEELGDYEDSGSYVVDCKMKIAESLVENKEFQDAINIYSELNDEVRVSAAKRAWLADYIETNGTAHTDGYQITRNQGDRTISLVASESGKYKVIIKQGNDVGYNEIIITLMPDTSTGFIQHEREISFTILGRTAYQKESGSCEIDTSVFNRGTMLNYNDYSAIGTGAEDMNASSFARSTMEFINDSKSALTQMLKETNIEINLSDLGFTSY
ncbi:MAG: hypothetical protein IKT52_03460 [Oscillospiraceae bacterium]|nr:hypothetical protein [Oscillospiraceae bacterium]